MTLTLLIFFIFAPFALTIYMLYTHCKRGGSFDTYESGPRWTPPVHEEDEL